MNSLDRFLKTADVRGTFKTDSSQAKKTGTLADLLPKARSSWHQQTELQPKYTLEDDKEVFLYQKDRFVFPPSKSLTQQFGNFPDGLFVQPSFGNNPTETFLRPPEGIPLTKKQRSLRNYVKEPGMFELIPGDLPPPEPKPFITIDTLTQRTIKEQVYSDGVPRQGVAMDLATETHRNADLGNAVTDLTSILRKGIPQQGALSVDDYKKLLAGQFQSPGVQSLIFDQEQQKIAAALALAGLPANVAAAIAPGFAGLPANIAAGLAPGLAGLPANLAAAIASLIPAPIAGGGVPGAGGPAPAPAPVPFSSLDAATKKALIETQFDKIIADNKLNIIKEINNAKLLTQKIIHDDYKGDMSKVPAELKNIQEKINKFDEVKFEKNVKGPIAKGAKLSATNKNALNALSALLISRLGDPEKTGYLSPTSTASSSPAGSPAGSRRGSAASSPTAGTPAAVSSPGSRRGSAAVAAPAPASATPAVAVAAPASAATTGAENKYDDAAIDALIKKVKNNKAAKDFKKIAEIIAKDEQYVADTLASGGEAQIEKELAEAKQSDGSSSVSTAMQEILDFYSKDVGNPITDVESDEYKLNLEGLSIKISDEETLHGLTQKEAIEQSDKFNTYFPTPKNYKSDAGKNHYRVKLLLGYRAKGINPGQDQIDNIMKANMERLREYKDDLGKAKALKGVDKMAATMFA
jgi:hypothetical protein